MQLLIRFDKLQKVLIPPGSGPEEKHIRQFLLLRLCQKVLRDYRRNRQKNSRRAGFPNLFDRFRIIRRSGAQGKAADHAAVVLGQFLHAVGKALDRCGRSIVVFQLDGRYHILILRQIGKVRQRVALSGLTVGGAEIVRIVGGNQRIGA